MKGHPILGIISGFFFGLFLGITLFMYGVIPLHSQLLWILPLVGIVLGLFMAAWAPFGSGRAPATASADTVSYGAAGDADMSQVESTTVEHDIVEETSMGSETSDREDRPDWSTGE
jgi:hypothetical protein